MIRLGLCCLFHQEPIRFRATTAKALAKLTASARPSKLAEIIHDNIAALESAVRYCHQHGIGSFRVNSRILPLYTHPELGYQLDDLPEGEDMVARFMEIGNWAKSHDVRISFHPDQFVVLNSPHERVNASSLREIEYQARVSDWLQGDVINIHGGGVFGNKAKALDALRRNIQRLSMESRARLTLENDDRLYTPEDLLPVCRWEGIPLVYDVHHHRCHPDNLTVEQATQAALATWNREPLFHISSPREGWNSGHPHYHHDYIANADFPECWTSLNVTVDVEAKHKEMAVRRLRRALKARGINAW